MNLARKHLAIGYEGLTEAISIPSFGSSGSNLYPSGSFATVMRAIKKETGEEVAIKIINR